MLNQSFIEQIFTESLLAARPCAGCLGYIHEQKGQDGVSWRSQSNCGGGGHAEKEIPYYFIESCTSLPLLVPMFSPRNFGLYLDPTTLVYLWLTNGL